MTTAPNPESVPWPRPDDAIRLELGERWVQIKLAVVDGSMTAALFDSDDQPVKTLRSKKGDDAELFKQAKEAWDFRKKRPRSGRDPRQQLALALLTGRSLTGIELTRLLEYEDDKVYQRVIWQAVDESTAGSFQFDADDEYVLSDIAGKPWAPEDDRRYRLLHPARLDNEAYAAWKTKHPDIQQLSHYRRDCRAPSKPTLVSTEFEISVPKGNGGVVRTPMKSIIAQLELAGFVRHPEDNKPFVLQAPELRAVALATIDDEHGFTSLSFRQWDGAPIGGAPIPLTEVDVQLYSEVVSLVTLMYDPADRG